MVHPPSHRTPGRSGHPDNSGIRARAGRRRLSMLSGHGGNPGMERAPTETAVRRLRAALDASAPGGPTDAELLDRFVRSRDEAAFELLVWRYRQLVLGVCRRVLRHEQDAEDAFQATFLVLARKAPSVAPRSLVGPFLYGVACKTARK